MGPVSIPDNTPTGRAVSLVTEEGLRAVLRAHLEDAWAKRSDLELAGLADVPPHKLEEVLFALEVPQGVPKHQALAHQRVAWELAYATFTLPEQGIVGTLPPNFLRYTTVRPIWEAQLEVMKRGQPQAMWGLVAATMTDVTQLREEVSLTGFASGAGRPAAMISGDEIMSNAQGEGVGPQFDYSGGSKKVIVKRTEVRVEAVFVDLSRSEHIDPNRGIEGYLPEKSPMAAYINAGRPARLMPAGMRNVREKCLRVIRAYAAQFEQQRAHEAAALDARLAKIDPQVVAALRAAGLSEAAIASNLSIPEGALARFKR